MRHLLGFLIPAAATVSTEPFVQQLALALIPGLFGVAGVTLAAYFRARPPGARRHDDPPEDK